jgi:hypothetical protein
MIVFRQATDGTGAQVQEDGIPRPPALMRVATRRRGKVACHLPTAGQGNLFRRTFMKFRNELCGRGDVGSPNHYGGQVKEAVNGKADPPALRLGGLA